MRKKVILYLLFLYVSVTMFAGENVLEKGFPMHVRPDVPPKTDPAEMHAG